MKTLLFSEVQSNPKLILDLLYQNKVLVLKGKPLDETKYLEFTRKLGVPTPFVDSNYFHPDHKEIFVVSNQIRNGKRFGMKRVGYYWHSDCSFLQEPLPITSLHCHLTPNKGGQTGFIDMAQVWRELPEEMKSKLRGKTITHDSSERYIVVESDIGMSLKEIRERDLQLCAPVSQPAVYKHFYTNEEILYLNEGFSSRIQELPQDESDHLLQEVFRRTVESPSRYLHQWEPGDIVLWDNRSVVHRAFPYEEGDRLMFRVGIRETKFFGDGNQL